MRVHAKLVDAEMWAGCAQVVGAQQPRGRCTTVQSGTLARCSCASRGVPTSFLLLRQDWAASALQLQQADDWIANLCDRQFFDKLRDEPFTFVDDQRYFCGLGSRFHRLASALLASVEENRPLVLSSKPRWTYAEGPHCAALGAFASHTCFFQPISSSHLSNRSRFPISEECAYHMDSDPRQRHMWFRTF